MALAIEPPGQPTGTSDCMVIAVVPRGFRRKRGSGCEGECRSEITNDSPTHRVPPWLKGRHALEIPPATVQKPVSADDRVATGTQGRCEDATLPAPLILGRDANSVLNCSSSSMSGGIH